MVCGLQRNWIAGIVFSLIGILNLFVALSFIFNERVKSVLPVKAPPTQSTRPTTTVSLVSSSFLSSDTYIQQRDEVSKILNTVKQELAIMSCEMIEMKRELGRNNSQSVSVSGGWCKETSYNNSGDHAFDRSLAFQLSKIFENKSVASFGDGPGDYKRYLDSTHRLKLYDAYDGAPFGPETSGGAVKFLDLTAPQYGLPVYDWVMSLEVAEHIPAEYESIYVDNVVRHAGSGIVLSWAIPGQIGLSHVNNKPQSYVKKLLSEKGFEVDMDSSVVLQKHSTLLWLKRNVFVYRRRKDSVLLPKTA